MIGNELKLAKEYMVQLAKKSTGEFMENENIIYKDSECEKHAKIPSSKMESVMSITTVPQSTRSVVVKLLIEKDGKTVVPILQQFGDTPFIKRIAPTPENSTYIFLASMPIIAFREYLKNCKPGKNSNGPVRTTVTLKIFRDLNGYHHYEKIKD